MRGQCFFSVFVVYSIWAWSDVSARETGEVAHFREVTDELGVDFTHQVVLGGAYALPEIMGSGLAVFDADGDGRFDLYFINAGETRGKGAPNGLYLRSHDGRYREATEASGLRDRGYGMGVAVGDIDNDGDIDIYVGNWGQDSLYLSNGDGTFVDATKTAGISGEDWTSSVAMLDFDVDGYLDIYVGHYVDFDPTLVCSSNQARRDYCGPLVFRGQRDTLLRNRSDGTFEDVSQASGISGAARPALGVLVDDFDDDGWPDVYVANDGEANLLWMNQKNGRFVESALLMGVAVNGQGASEAGMGVASGDVDGDGDRDLFMTHLADQTNTLYLREDGIVFSDHSTPAGLGDTSLVFTGFGTLFFDLEHDGDLDLPVVNGRVLQGARGDVDGGFWDLYAEPNQLFLNNGRGHFRETPWLGTSPGPIEVSRGLAAADLDADGDLDLILTNTGGRSRIYENMRGEGHWLEVSVREDGRNRDAFGARISVRAGDKTFSRYVGSSGSYMSSVVTPSHFGLGESTRVDRIDVLWPGGVAEAFPGTETNQAITLVRGGGVSNRP